MLPASAALATASARVCPRYHQNRHFLDWVCHSSVPDRREIGEQNSLRRGATQATGDGTAGACLFPCCRLSRARQSCVVPDPTWWELFRRNNLFFKVMATEEVATGNVLPVRLLGGSRGATSGARSTSRKQSQTVYR